MCLLPPPCQHLSKAQLYKLGLARRKELPQREESLTCYTFARTGACRIFNLYGHCSLDHPLDLHDVRRLTRRCPTCTLPLEPRNMHCGNCSAQRKRMIAEGG